MSNHKHGIQLNCFSPPVMVATLTVESCLAAYTVWRYKMTALTRLIAGSLFMLAIFQLAEFFVCTGYGFRAEQWSRIGFVAITTLPPLGLHMLHHLAGKPGRRIVYTAYATMTAFVAFFLTYPTAFIGHQCTGNYVIFQIGGLMAGLYGLYYYGWIFTALLLGWQWLKPAREAADNEELSRLETIKGLMVGYLIFLVPTAIANTLRPETRRGIPSIMCGFAVLFALILAFYVLPRAAAVKRALSSGKEKPA